MAVFAALLPFLISWFSAQYLSKRLMRWWGVVLAWIVSTLLGTMSPILYGILSELNHNLEFEGMFFVRMIANAFWVSAIIGAYSIWRTRKKLKLVS